MAHKEYRSPLQQVMDKGWADASSAGSAAYRDAMIKIREDNNRQKHRVPKESKYRSNTAVWNGYDWIEP